MSDAASLKLALSEMPLTSLALHSLPDPNHAAGFMDGDAWDILFHASLTRVTRLEVGASPLLLPTRCSTTCPVPCRLFHPW